MFELDLLHLELPERRGFIDYDVVIPGRVYCDLLIVKRNICPNAAEYKKTMIRYECP